MGEACRAKEPGVAVAGPQEAEEARTPLKLEGLQSWAWTSAWGEGPTGAGKEGNPGKQEKRAPRDLYETGEDPGGGRGPPG